MKAAEPPTLPADLSIGVRRTKKIGRTHITGAIKAEIDEALGIYAGESTIFLHERGIKIRNIYYEKELNIHRSQIRNISEFNLQETYYREGTNIGGLLLGILLVITLGLVYLFIDDMSRSNKSTERTYYVTYLLLTFWDVNTKSEQKIFFSASKPGIKRFIKQYKSQ